MTPNGRKADVLTLPQAALAFGCANTSTGASTSRTFMGKELKLLLEGTAPDASAADYTDAVIEQNALLKPSMQTRRKTYGYLRDRYALDPAVPLFRVLRTLCDADPGSLPLLAMLTVVARDPVLRATAPCIADAAPGSTLASADLAQVISAAFPGMHSQETLDATSERAMSTWVQAGHYTRGNPHLRQRVHATPATVTLALILGTLSGVSGEQLLTTLWARLIDGTPQALLALARSAAQRGWLEYRHAGGILDISFRQLAPEIEAMNR